MKSIDQQREVLSELTDGCMAFFRETRNGSVDIAQANVGAKFAQRTVSAVGMDLKLQIAAPKLIENISAA